MTSAAPTDPHRQSPPGDPVLTDAVLADLAAAPTPYHAVERSRALLVDAGFRPVDLAAPLPGGPGRYLATTGGTLVAWIQQAEHRGFTVVGAHTDSPNLRVRTNPDLTSAGYEQVGMEIYGGVLLNSWLDRGLGLAGRVSLTGEDGGVEERLVLDDRPLLIIPQLAIHLDRDVNSGGLKLDPQKHMIPLWSLEGAHDDGGSVGALKGHVAGLLDIDPARIVAWDLMAFDTQAPAVIGRHGELFSSGRIDNLLSSFCAIHALRRVVEDGATPQRTPVLALYDHEEVGSESATGAAGAYLASLLERIAAAEGADRAAFLAALHRSIVVSADGAHATHPNYVERHEPSHKIRLNHGVVVKRHANQRYATDAISEGFMVEACRAEELPLQFYLHRNDLPCGSTIGPITAARLAVPTVDIGAPQLAMHSARETAGVADIDYLARTLAAAWRHDP
ncbi:MAG: M18 family aminopeptidase [Actinomycetota bacterium]